MSVMCAAVLVWERETKRGISGAHVLDGVAHGHGHACGWGGRLRPEDAQIVLLDVRLMCSRPCEPDCLGPFSR